MDTSTDLAIYSAVRSPKAETLKTAYSEYEGKVEIVVVDDLIKGDFTDTLHGVSALIHVASPGPGRDKTKALIDVSTSPAYAFAHMTTLIQPSCRVRSAER